MRYLVFTIFFTKLLIAQWEPDVRLTNDTATSHTNYNHAKCIASAGCSLHIVWCDYRDGNGEIYYKRSTNDGTDWGQDTRLTYDIYSSVYPAIAASHNVIHITWVGLGGIHYKRSINGGSTWLSDTIVSSVQDAADPSIAVSDSHVYVGWWGSMNQDTIYFTKSDDAGQTWRKDTALIDLRASAIAPYIASYDSIVYIFWYDHDLGGYYETFYKYSNDFGSTWSRDTQLTFPPNTSADPCASISGNDIHVAWTGGIAKGTNVNFEIFYKHSTDRGTTWSADTNLSYSLGWCRFQSISASASNVHLVWIDDYGGYWDIYYKKSSNRGYRWDSTVRLTNEPAVSTYPHTTTAGSGVHVIWTDDRNRQNNYNREIYYKRNLTGNIGIEEEQSLRPRTGTTDRIEILPNPVVTNKLKIRFTIHGMTNMKLVLYDPSGQLVGILIDGKLNPGTYERLINDEFNPGVYFVSLQTKNRILTKKLVIIE